MLILKYRFVKLVESVGDLLSIMNWLLLLPFENLFIVLLRSVHILVLFRFLVFRRLQPSYL